MISRFALSLCLWNVARRCWACERLDNLRNRCWIRGKRLEIAVFGGGLARIVSLPSRRGDFCFSLKLCLDANVFV